MRGVDVEAEAEAAEADCPPLLVAVRAEVTWKAAARPNAAGTIAKLGSGRRPLQYGLALGGDDDDDDGGVTEDCCGVVVGSSGISHGCSRDITACSQ